MIYVELLNAEFVKYVANKVSKNERNNIYCCMFYSEAHEHKSNYYYYNNNNG